MAERRTITIESPPENTLSVQVEAGLVDRFVRTATESGGSWRRKNKQESFEEALASAVGVAFLEFLHGVGKEKT